MDEGADTDSEDRHSRLVTALAELAELLTAAGERHWAAWATRNCGYIVRGQAHALDTILGGFGGMGSFNELILYPRNGHTLAAEDVEAVNGRLGALRSVIVRLATELRRELDQDWLNRHRPP